MYTYSHDPEVNSILFFLGKIQEKRVSEGLRVRRHVFVIDEDLGVIMKVREFVFVIVFWDFADIMRDFEANLEVFDIEAAVVVCRVLLDVFVLARLRLF